MVFRMWRGDPAINAYVDDWAASRLHEAYGITLRAVSGQGPELVNQLVLERGADARGSMDLVWINGETFHNLRREDLLWGPWAGRLPNAAYVDSASDIIMRDFEQDPAGYESPWGRVEFVLIYDTVRVPDPPRTYAELEDWIIANPGRFTHDQGFTGITFLKGLMYALSGGVASLRGGFDSVRYDAASERVWRWIERVRPGFWRGGRTYPSDLSDLHRLFANGEVDFTMAYNAREVANKVRHGVFPPTARALVLRDGALANAHYVGIPFNAENPAGAMVVADFLLSPEAQLYKARPDTWADGSVLDIARLPPEWAERFTALDWGERVPDPDTLAFYARPEVAPEYHERLAEDWRRRVRDVVP